MARGQKDYDVAIQYFQAALKKDRKDAVIYNKLGLAQLKNEDLKSARWSFDKASKCNRKYAEAINNIGAVEYMKKNFGGAAKYFKKAGRVRFRSREPRLLPGAVNCREGGAAVCT